MYGLWHNDLNKWMIDRFNHETQEEDVALFKCTLGIKFYL